MTKIKAKNQSQRRKDGVCNDVDKSWEPLDPSCGRDTHFSHRKRRTRESARLNYRETVVDPATLYPEKCEWRSDLANCHEYDPSRFWRIHVQLIGPWVLAKGISSKSWLIMRNKTQGEVFQTSSELHQTITKMYLDESDCRNRNLYRQLVRWHPWWHLTSSDFANQSRWGKIGAHIPIINDRPTASNRNVRGVLASEKLPDPIWISKADHTNTAYSRTKLGKDLFGERFGTFADGNIIRASV